MYFVFLGLFNFIPATWKSLLESTAERFDASTILQGSELNPRKYKRTYTTAAVQGGEGGGMVGTPPLGFCGVTIFGKYFTSNR